MKALRLLNKLRLQIHRAKAVDLARDIVSVISVREANIFDLSANLNCRRRAFDFEFLDDNDRVSVLKNIPVGVANMGVEWSFLFDGLLAFKLTPLMGAKRADPQVSIGVSVFGIAFRAFRFVH